MMRRYFLLLSLLISLCAEAQSGDENRIWFKNPANVWDEALPVGNGRLGCMVFGHTGYERIQLNEETLWTGSRNLITDKPDAAKYLPVVRQLLFDGKYAEAQDIVERDMMGAGNWTMYQTLGDLYLSFPGMGAVSGYARELKLDSALAKVSYVSDNVSYTRECFSSPVDQVIAIRISASQLHKLNFGVRLQRPKDARVQAFEKSISMEGQVTSGGADMQGLNPGVTYYSRLDVVNEGGTVTISADSLLVANANSVVVYLAAATNYWGKKPKDEVSATLEKAEKKAYAALKSDMVTEHQRLFNRVQLRLGTSDKAALPTDERLAMFKNDTNDPQLLSLYFQFGRYLLICSSRPGNLAANLQGIWADGLIPPWSADYHININIQMNYWPAEITNLSECHLPFIALTDSLRRAGRETARKMYNCRGFTAHFTTDAWYWTSTFGKAEWGMWPMGAAWCCQHVWEHFAFTNDTAYLRSVYPILKEASLFFADYLTPDPKTGFLVTGPSSSPENKFRTADGKISNITMGPTMDLEITYDLLTNTIKASELLNTDSAFRNQLVLLRSKLSPLKIGTDGRLMEWTEAFDEPEPGHRHISHLFGLYPGKQISVTKTPELAEAARKSIEYRLAHGGGHTGWSRAWIINDYARLLDGDKAYEHLVALLQKSTLSNLFDNHPPFQIDGNFGGTAAIAEMLVQSQTDEIQLLPALPSAFKVGEVSGLCARGGFEVAIKWYNNKLAQARITSTSGRRATIRYGNKTKCIELEKGASVILYMSDFE